MPTSTDITNLKINKLTEAQYDAAVQGGTIGENEISILTDFEYAQMIKPTTMPTLAAADWSANAQTITVSGVTSSNVVFVSPAPASVSDYTNAGIICTAQGTDSLSFSCVTTPTNDITLNVVIF